MMKYNVVTTERKKSMFVVIQEIDTKKSNKDGYAKELKSEYLSVIFNGEDIGHYWHCYSDERFERPVKKAYRISIHHSFRKNGKVQKKQFVLCTVNYYDLAMDIFTVYDWCDSKIALAAEGLSVSIDEIYELVERKLEPLINKIQHEFHETEEFKTHEKHEKITTIYAAKKAEFNEKYDVSGDEYDRIYDVFGKCHNPKYLEKIKADYKARKEYERKSWKQSSSYYEKFYGNYEGYGGGSYYNTVSSNYNESDKAMLKKFYRTLSKVFHPDSNQGVDTSEEMKLLNRLKNDWKL